MCIKQVPTREWQPRIDETKRGVREQDASFEMNEPDAYALEEGLRLREKHNGEVVVCDGLGVPYPTGANTFEQGPCGYTYTERPPVDGYTVTVTGHWEVHLATSDGVNQPLDPIDMPYAFPYDVDEIVTVGEA